MSMASKSNMVALGAWQPSDGRLLQQIKEIRERVSIDGGREIRKTAETIRSIFQTMSKLSSSHLNSLDFYKWMRTTHNTFKNWRLESVLHPNFVRLYGAHSDKQEENKQEGDKKGSPTGTKKKTEEDDDFNSEARLSGFSNSYASPTRNLTDDFEEPDPKARNITFVIQQMSTALAQAMAMTLHADLQYLTMDSTETGITPAKLWAKVLEWGFPNPAYLSLSLKGKLQDVIREAFRHSKIEDALVIVNDHLEFIKLLSHGQDIEFDALFQFIKKAIDCKSDFIRTAFVSHHVSNTFQSWDEMRNMLRKWASEDEVEQIKAPTAMVANMDTKEDIKSKPRYPCGYCKSDKHIPRDCELKKKNLKANINIPGVEGSYFAKLHARKAKSETKALLVGSPPGGAPTPEVKPQLAFKSKEELRAHLAEVKDAMYRMTAQEEDQESAFMITHEPHEALEQSSNFIVEAIIVDAVLDSGATINLFHKPTAEGLYNRRHIPGRKRLTTAKTGVSMALDEAATLSAMCGDQEVTLQGYFVPELTNTLISVAALLDEGLRARWSEDGRTIDFFKPSDSTKTLYAFKRRYNLFVTTLRIRKSQTALTAQAHSPTSPAQIIHNSLGHVGVSNMREQLKAKARGLEEEKEMLQTLANSLQKGKKGKEDKDLLQTLTKLIKEAESMDNTESVVKQALENNEQKSAEVKEAQHQITGLQRFDCIECDSANMKQQPHPRSTHSKVNLTPFEEVNSDAAGPFTPSTSEKHKFFITFICRLTSYIWISLMCTTAETCNKLKEFLEWTKLHNLVPKILRSDNGSTYASEDTQEVLKQNRIIPLTSPPYEHESNGYAETFNNILQKSARAALVTSGLPKSYWGRAILWAAGTRNSLVKNGIQRTMAALGHREERENCPFGSLTIVHNPTETRNSKLADRGTKCVFLGWPSHSRVTCCYLNLETDKVIERRQGKNYPSIFPFMSEPSPSLTMKLDEDEIKKDEEPRRSKREHKEREDKVSMPVDFTNKSALLKPFPQQEYERLEEEYMKATGKKPTGSTYSRLWDEAHNIRAMAFNETIMKEEFQANLCLEFNNHFSHRVLMAEMLENKNLGIIAEPRGEWEVKNHPYAKEFREAEAKELQALIAAKVFIPLPKEKVPAGANILPNVTTYKVKRDPATEEIEKFKARFCANGKKQEGVTLANSFAATPASVSIKIALILICFFGWEMCSLDVVCAFLIPLLEIPEYIYPARWMKYPAGTVLELKKCLYGLKTSPQAWRKEVQPKISEWGFTPVREDQCFYAKFVNNKIVAILIVHVDDFLLGGEKEVVATMKKKISEAWQCTSKDNPTSYLGIEIERDREKGTITLKQTSHVKRFLQRINIADENPKNSPMTEAKFSRQPRAEPTTDKETLEHEQWMHEVVGSLLYLVGTRPDIAYSVNNLSQMIKDTQKQLVCKLINRIGRYLKGTLQKGITYDKQQGLTLEASSDANWGGERGRSTTGFIVTLGKMPILFKTHLQPIVALSVHEAELVAAAEATQQVMGVRNILTSLHLPPSKATVIHIDNKSTIDVIITGKRTDRTRHIEVRWYYTVEQYENKNVDVRKVSTLENKADGLTKALGPKEHQRWSRLLE